MLKNKKRLKAIEEEKRLLEKEKQELLFIKEQLEETTSKVNVSNVYVWKDRNIYSIVRLEVQNIRGRNWSGVGKVVDGYQSTLIDIFSNKIIYEKNSMEMISREQYIRAKSFSDGYYAYLLPLHDVDKNLLAYADKMVPLYVLQRLYYKLNNVDTSANILKKQQKF